MQTRSSAPAPDLAACRESLRNGSRTFLAASLLLPSAVRDPACALYAYCRMADDQIDGAGAPADALAGLRQRLDDIYLGRPAPVVADRALAAVVHAYAIPRAIPEALLEGFAWDAAGRRYETLEQLQGYAARVAGTVGVMMALLMGVRSPAGLARACDLGVAMQLSNIARDVGEDARMGRIYLPLAWLREAGLEPAAWLARPVHSTALGSVVQRLLRAADALYARVDDGVAELPLGCRPGINAARFLYAGIGHQVRRQGLNAVDARAVLPGWRKGLLLLPALLRVAPRRPDRPAPPLAATRFLVEAVLAGDGPRAAGDAATGAPSPAAPVWWRLDQRVVAVIELFERLGQRERGEPGRAGRHLSPSP